MTRERSAVWSALVLAVSFLAAGLGSPVANASVLLDYVGKNRPLLVFAPANNDPRLVDTQNRVSAARCDFADRDMVLGVIAARGNSSIDGRPINATESQRLRDQYKVIPDGFTVLLIGKDGGEKLRINDVPDLRSVYSVIDGMSMRRQEMGAGSDRC